MEENYNYPGIYVSETLLLPKSVAQVETSVPAFVGYTEKALYNGRDLHSNNIVQPLEINSFIEYENIFGGPPEPVSIDVELGFNSSNPSVITEDFSFLYYSVKLYFMNGGTTCLIVSVGSYASAAGKVSKQQLLKGLAALEKTDTPTLLSIPETVMLSFREAGEVHGAMLMQAGKMKNRFALLDLVKGNAPLEYPEHPVINFRENLAGHYLSFGAAYYPWLVTSWTRKTKSSSVVSARYFQNGASVGNLEELFRPETVHVLQKSEYFRREKIDPEVFGSQALVGTDDITAFSLGFYYSLKRFYNLVSPHDASAGEDMYTSLHRSFVAKGSAFHSIIRSLQVLSMRNHLPIPAEDFSAAFHPLTFTGRPLPAAGRSRIRRRSLAAALKPIVAAAEQLFGSFYTETGKLDARLHEQLKLSDEKYRMIAGAIESQHVVVPATGAVAGTFSRVDRERGVWKAPANIPLNPVITPAAEISQQQQDTLNVDATEGKSVNAIRTFQGRGVVVWGARTLAGNDNEWRYVNVRRFIIMVEQSVSEAIRPFSFEPNNQVTWTRVKTMIENFYYLLWKAGALQGTKPEHAYFVKIGVGETMTPADIDNGTMIILSGLAVAKPAEFLIISVSQKMITG